MDEPQKSQTWLKFGMGLNRSSQKIKIKDFHKISVLLFKNKAE
ncbi:hypothetical protein SAMN05444407_105289 [Chryseobacterium contaminans]|uniref:Uncharacterized protein n=1 Tax=Chryseobacterium contaminans TaxID=1423959 RepID=A0A1M7CNW9_9FLAO|nr:hypothetical protein SAMN05444407_105289 [Chryseobacterium contaminans]